MVPRCSSTLNGFKPLLSPPNKAVMRGYLLEGLGFSPSPSFDEGRVMKGDDEGIAR